MILSMLRQFHIFLLTIGIGVLTGFLYDIFRIIRKTFEHSDYLIQLEDILYWILVTTIMFKFIINKNDGEIRPFLIGGLIIGMVFYFITLSSYFLEVSIRILHILKRVLKLIIEIILTPIKLILKVLKIPAIFVKNKAIIVGSNSKKLLQKSNRYVKIKGKKTFKDIKIILKKI